MVTHQRRRGREAEFIWSRSEWWEKGRGGWGERKRSEEATEEERQSLTLRFLIIVDVEE